MPALAALAAIPTTLLVGMAVLLGLFAYYVLFQKPLTQLLEQLPVIGGQVAGAVANAMGGLVSWFAKQAANTLDQVNAWIRAIPNLVVYGFDAVNDAMVAILNYAQSAVTALDNGLGAMGDAVASAVNKVAAVAAAVATAGARIDILVERIARIVDTRIPNAIASVQSWASAAIGAAVLAMHDAIMDRVNALGQAIDTIHDGLLWRIGQAIDGLRAELGQVIAGVHDGLVARLDGLEGTIQSIHDGLLWRVDQLTGALAPILALELTRVIPALRTQVDTMERECVTPTCSAMRPNLDALNALNDGLMLAAILGLAAEAYRDPEGMAQATVGFTHGIESAAADVLGTFGVGR